MSENIDELKKRVETLERMVTNHMRHSDLVTLMLSTIRENEILSLDQLRKKYPSCYGSTQKRLYDAMDEDPNRYMRVTGHGRGYKTILVHLTSENTPRKTALQYYLTVSQRERQKGSKHEIAQLYKLSPDQVEEAWLQLTEIFEKHIIVKKQKPIDEFMTKQYYKEHYVKTLKATGRRY